MTREEAATILYKEWQRFLEDNLDYAGISDAYKMAINTLKQEPCEDCISRKTVFDMCKKEIDHISKNWQNYHSPSEAKSGFVYIATNIYDLPPVNPQPKTGHWIEQKKIGFGEWKECIVPLKDGYVTGSCSCSECGEWLTGSDEYQCSGNYCPNCGSRMSEGSDEK